MKTDKTADEVRALGNELFNKQKYNEAKDFYLKSLSKSIKAETVLSTIKALNNLVLVALKTSNVISENELKTYHALLMRNMTIAHEKGELPDDSRWKALSRCSQAFAMMDRENQKEIIKKYGNQNHTMSGKDYKLAYSYQKDEGVGLKLDKASSNTFKKGDPICYYFGKELNSNFLTWRYLAYRFNNKTWTVLSELNTNRRIISVLIETLICFNKLTCGLFTQ